MSGWVRQRTQSLESVLIFLFAFNKKREISLHDCNFQPGKKIKATAFEPVPTQNHIECSVVCQLIFSWLHFPLSFLFPKTHLLSRIVQIHALLEQTHFSGLMSSPSTFSLNSLRERPPRIKILKESTRQEVVVWFYYSFSVLFGNWFFLFLQSDGCKVSVK